MKIFQLSLFYILFGLMLSFSCTNTPGKKQEGKLGVHKLSPKEFVDTFKKTKDAVLIDVRTAKEFRSGALLPEAINIDYHDKDFLSEMIRQDKNAPTFLYCYAGQRSDKAIFKMKQLGFTKLYDLTGGYALWEKEK